MTPSKALFWFCISFIVGIALQSVIKIPQIFLWGFLVFGALVIIISFWLARSQITAKSVILATPPTPKVIFGMWGFYVLFLVLGIVRLQIAEFNTENDKLRGFNDIAEKVILTGQITGEPDVRESSQKLKIRVDDSVILITTGNYPEFNYLDEVKVTGYLKTPLEFPARNASPTSNASRSDAGWHSDAGGEDFNYKNYLLKDGIYSVMDFPKIELISQEHNYNVFSFFYEKTLFLKGKLVKSIEVNFQKQDSEVLKGIVFGNDKNMAKDLKGKFNATGLSHITAVSGSNIVILISILMSLLLFVGFWRSQAFYFSIGLIWLYIVLIGFPASGIRAAIMGSIFLTSEFFGRQNTSSRTIVLAGSLMLLQNPLLLFYDIGFQLSFLASMGIIHIKPIFDNFILSLTSFWKDSKDKLKEFSSKAVKFLLDIVSVTISAQIFVLPVIVYNFSNISLISPLTNLLVLPIIPFLMVFGLLVSILGIFSGFLGWVFALPCYVLLFYFLKILDIFSQPWATINPGNVSWTWYLLYYVILIISIQFLQKKLKPKFLGY